VDKMHQQRTATRAPRVPADQLARPRLGRWL